MRSVHFIFAVVVVLVHGWVSPAFADEGAPERVEELKKRGNQSMMDLNYAEALAAYTAALALAPDDAALYYNLGRAHQAREDYPAAFDALSRFARSASPAVRARVPKLVELMEDVRTRVGTLAVRCTADVPDATIAIGDRTSATGCTTAPKEIRISVPARQAVVDVKLTADAYQAQSARIPVTGGGPVVAVTLAVLPKATSGKLFVRATPPDARISIDGVERGNPPLEVPIAVGAHTLDLSANHHDAKHLPIVIEAGKTKDMTVELQRSAPITTKWWFWTGVGVVVTGIVLTTWYLVAQPESDPSNGTIAPGQVSAPLVRF